MHLRTQGDVRRFTVVMTLYVLLASLALRLLFLPPDLATRTMLPGAIIALMLTVPSAYYLGHRLRLAQERAEQQANACGYDNLTGLATRALIYEKGAAVREEPGVVILADIDNFKAFNDAHGHLTGDQALRHFASVLSANCRAGDFVARFGGEEFVLLLERTRLEDGLAVARRICRRIRQSPLLTDDHTLAMTASFGVAPLLPGAAMDDAIRAADHALYLSKREGRDRVTLCESCKPCDATRSGSRAFRQTKVP